MSPVRRLKPPSSPHPTHIFYGWRVVGASVVGLALIGGTSFQGLGIFFVALEQSFGWSRAVLSGAFSISRAEGAFLGPIEGLLTDRVGSRRMVLIGMGILGAGFLMFSQVKTPVGFYLAFLVIFSGAGLGGWIPLMTAINNWFIRHRSKAMAAGMTGFNLGGLLVPVLAWAVTTFGWRDAAIACGLIVWAMMFPLAFVVRTRPEDVGLRPLENPTSGQVQDGPSLPLQAPQDEVSFTLKQALKTQAFWLITVAHTMSVVSVAVIAVHIVPALTDKGITLTMSGVVVATYTITAAVFQMVGGFLGDRFPKPPAIAVFIAIQGIGMVLAAAMNNLPMVFLFAILYGIGFGGRTPLLTAIRGDYFGRKNFATILGTSQLVMNLITMAAPFLAGYLFDRWGSYTAVFLGLAAMNLVGALSILPLRNPGAQR